MTNTGYDFADRAGLQAWLRAQSGDNSQRRQRLLRNLPRAVAAELTPRQREILALYIDRGMTMSQIAQQLRINKSTVSRSLGARSSGCAAVWNTAFDGKKRPGRSHASRFCAKHLCRRAFSVILSVRVHRAAVLRCVGRDGG